jgi:hypothetical protein
LRLETLQHAAQISPIEAKILAKLAGSDVIPVRQFV